MGRAILVMASTLCFGIFGAVMAWLNVQAIIAVNTGSSRLTDTIALSYTFGPLIGAAIGFGLSFVTLAMFGRQQRSANDGLRP